jgi:hypothetical protein
MQADLRTVAWTVVLLMSLGGCATAPAEPGTAAGLVGNWRLLAVETLRDKGEVSTVWMGEKPLGLITYQPNGLMSVQIMRDPRPLFASGSRASATPEELKRAFLGYYAYWGTYAINPVDNSVSHQLAASLYPEEVGIVYKRFFKIEGPRLVLTTAPITYDGRQIVNRLTWEKMAAP